MVQGRRYRSGCGEVRSPAGKRGGGEGHRSQLAQVMTRVVAGGIWGCRERMEAR